MTTKQGDLALLDDPVAQELQHSTNLARLEGHGGSPHVVGSGLGAPIATYSAPSIGDEIALGCYPRAL